MRRYDPDRAPEPAVWLELDESERLDLVARAHKAEGGGGHSALGHAAMHVAVENQIAMRDGSAVPTTLARLMREGLDRHDAVHAIASVLTRLLVEIQGGEWPVSEFATRYREALERLDARSWLEDDRSPSTSA